MLDWHPCQMCYPLEIKLLLLLLFRHGKYKWTVISFSTIIFTKTKCQVSLVV